MISPFVNLNQMSSDSTLYHYTGIGGTHGILQNKFIRATKSDFLNDSNEVRYILTIAQEVIHDVTNPVWQSILQTGFDWASMAMKRLHYYVLSFSTEPDSLTLWSEFGDNTGYNMEFQSGELLKRISRYRPIAYHGSVIYDKTLQKELLRKLIYIDIPASLGESFHDIMEHCVETMNHEQFDQLCRYVEQSLLIYALFFKQEEFAPEKEYRMVFEENDLNQVLFREKDGFLLPYISVRIASELEEVPLKSITVAPKNHIDLAKNGMMLYLQSLGYEVPVRLSGIKLRY